MSESEPLESVELLDEEEARVHIIKTTSRVEKSEVIPEGQADTT